MSERNYDVAIGHCREALGLSPDNVRAKELMEDAQSKLEAEVFVKQNLKRAQDSFQNRDFQKCISECQKIQLLDPDNPQVADLLSKAQQKLEAEPFIQNFISSGQSLFNSGLYGEAVAQWEKVRSIDASYPSLDSMIKTAKDKMGGGSGDGSGAMFDLGTGGSTEAPGFGFDDLSIGTAAAPSAAEPASDEDRITQLLREGDELYNEGQYQRAIEVWSEIFMLDVNHPEALQKIEAAKAASSQQQDQIKQLVGQLQSAYEEGNVDQARELCEKVLALDANNIEAKKYLGRLGEKDKGPSSVEELVALGETAEEDQRYREAAQYFSQALAIDSDNVTLADKIKNLNMLAKRQEQSKVLFGNAKAFLAEGKADSARHALAKILESDPGNQEALDLMKEVKQMEASSPAGSAAPRAAAPRAAAPAKGFPIIPAAIAAVVVVVVLGAAYFFLNHGKADTSKIEAPPVKKSVKKTPPKASAPAQPAPTQTTAVPLEVTPEARDKANRAVQEANFYYQARHLPEAQQKLGEALSLDPQNKDAMDLKAQVDAAVAQDLAQEQKMLSDANAYFSYSEFAGAVELYEKYLDKHPEMKEQLQPQVVKCYYNLGVLAIRTYNCDRAADYFRQVLFIDSNDQLSKDALEVAHQCQKAGTTDIEVRKAVALMDIRK